MINILFVCHGNICRSPMAEFVMKKLAWDAGAENWLYIESAGTSSEELGSGVYPPARRILRQNGIDCAGKTARQMSRSDYARFDLIVGMDHWNMKNMLRICGGDPENKLRLLMDYTRRPGEVADPWYTDNFESAWRDIGEGCHGLLAALIKNEGGKPLRRVE